MMTDCRQTGLAPRWNNLPFQDGIFARRSPINLATANQCFIITVMLRVRKKCLYLLACAVFLTPVPGWAASAGLAPHKAIYDIKMVSRHSGAQVLNISGQMMFEGKITCDAWTTDHRFKLLYEYADAVPMRITSDFSTYESMDGKDFSFTSRRERNGELFEEVRGHAILDKDNKGEALFSLPDGLKFDLASGTMFPISHTQALLQNVNAGKKFFSTTVFDGSDQDGPVEINAFIGKPVANIKSILSPVEAIDKMLVASPAHNVRMAFFPLNRQESEADYEMDIVLHDNGIISDMLVDYGDFSVTQKLVALEKLDVPACGTQKAK